jgi:hypothetical protein
MMNAEQREVMNTLLMSPTFASLSAAMQGAPKIESREELEAMLAFSAVEVLRHMDADAIGYANETAEMHHVSLMALVFSLLFDGIENFAAVTSNTKPTWIN